MISFDPTLEFKRTVDNAAAGPEVVDVIIIEFKNYESIIIFSGVIYREYTAGI